MVQARREFLNNRRSGDFGYNTEAAGAGEVDDGWDFQSFVSPSAAADRNKSPATLIVAECHKYFYSSTINF